MQLAETLAALQHLGDDTQVTLSVRAGDLRRALEQRGGGPALMTTQQAAKTFGYTAEQWRRWAQAGKIDGAYQGADNGPWHLPREACAAHLLTIRRRAKAPAPTPLRLEGSPRGPRKKHPARELAPVEAPRASTV
jgi:hypothetical protein